MDAWFAEWFDEDYAALYAHRDGAEAAVAVETALLKAPELADGPVLDLACGEGRHLAALRQHNPEAFGLDLSATLLARAPAALRPWLLRGDMRALPFRPGALAGITLWFTPFGYFPDAENRAVVKALGRCLRPGGVLLLDLFNPKLLARTLVPEDVVEREGLRVRSQRSLEDGFVLKRMSLTRLDDGRTREVVERVRLYPPEAMDVLAAEAGLMRVETWGEYRGRPFDSESSPRWIALYKVKP